MSRKLKDSGIPWIGQVPEGWNVARIAALYDLRSEKCSDKDFLPLSVTMKGIVPQLEDVAKTNNGDERKLVRAGDFVINSRSDRRGSCGISRLDGSVSLINTVLQPRGVMNPDYYNWVFHSPEFADEFYAWGHGIVDDLWTTRWSDMKSILVPTPPLSEQKAIAEFLDGKCAEIDGLREKIEKQIATLEEYKKSLITESVTRGLDPNAPMKDSGVPWIGQVPEGWKVERLPFQFSFSKGLNITKADLVEEGIAVISYGQIHAKHNNGVHLQPSLLRFVPESVADADGSARLKFGDIVFADTSEDLDGAGNCVLVDTREEVFAGYHTLVARPNQADFARYFAYLFQSPNWRSQLRSTVNGIKVFSITQRVLRGTTIIVPPLSEQKAIAEFLDGKCAEIDAETEKCRGMLERLEEYKKALIFECVTGKKEVV